MKMLLLGMTLIISQAVFSASEPNRSAPQGGTLNYNFDAEPESLHPLMGGDTYSTYFKEYVFDYLCTNSDQTWELTPRIAERWEISKNGLEVTFFLRKDAYFHNGENVTADDVKFSFEAIREPKHQALNLVPYFEKFNKVEVIDKYTVKFVSSETYFQNLTTLCTNMPIMPKSVYGDVNKSVKMQKEAIGSGPFKLVNYDKAQSITVKKFDKWYGDKTKEWKGYFNFEQVNFRFTKEDNILIERLKKGDIDFARLTSESYKKAENNLGKKAIAVKVENSEPKAFGFIGFNFKREIFQDKNTRLAFAHLVNRDLMNKKFYNGWNYLATSPVYVKSEQAPANKPIEFNPKKAQELLTKAGWADSDKNGLLDKTINGQKVEFKVSLIYANKDSEKLWTIVKEDAKKAGIEIELKLLEWNSFVKTIDDKNFDLMAMGWGGGDVEDDPKQIWHSTSNGKGGSNYISYSNPEVDKLIDQARMELDKPKRKELFKKVYGMIADDVPYVFMFNRKFEYYANSTKVKKAGDTFKYNFGYRSWWAAEK